MSQSWVRIGALCECTGEGRGVLWKVDDIRGDSVWLVSLEPIYGSKRGGYPLGWKALSGCRHTAKAKKAETPAPIVPISRQCRFCKTDTKTVYSGMCKTCEPIYRAGQASGRKMLLDEIKNAKST